MGGPLTPGSDIGDLALPAQVTHPPCPEMAQSIRCPASVISTWQRVVHRPSPLARSGVPPDPTPHACTVTLSLVGSQC